MKVKNTNFIISKVNARDAIYIDKVERYEGKLILKGVVNNRILSLEYADEFVPIEIVFEYVVYLEIKNVDYSPYSSQLKSNFVILENSTLIENFYKNESEYIDGEYQHYILSEYDEIYQIIAGKCDVII